MQVVANNKQAAEWAAQFGPDIDQPDLSLLAASTEATDKLRVKPTRSVRV